MNPPGDRRSEFPQGAAGWPGVPGDAAQYANMQRNMPLNQQQWIQQQNAQYGNAQGGGFQAQAMMPYAPAQSPMQQGFQPDGNTATPQMAAFQQQQFLLRQQAAALQMQQRQGNAQQQMSFDGAGMGGDPSGSAAMLQAMSQQQNGAYPMRQAIQRPLSSMSQHSHVSVQQQQQQQSMLNSPMVAPSPTYPAQGMDGPHHGNAPSPAGSAVSAARHALHSASPVAVGPGNPFAGQPGIPMNGQQQYQQGAYPATMQQQQQHQQQQQPQQQSQQQQYPQGAQFAGLGASSNMQVDNRAPSAQGMNGQASNRPQLATAPAGLDPRAFSLISVLNQPSGAQLLQQQPHMYEQVIRAREMVQKGQIAPQVLQNLIQQYGPQQQQQRMMMQQFQQAQGSQQPGVPGNSAQHAQPTAATPTAIAKAAALPSGMQADPSPVVPTQTAGPSFQPVVPNDVKPAINGSRAPATVDASVATEEVMKEWRGSLHSYAPLTRIQPLPVDKIDEQVDSTFGGQLPTLAASDIAAVRAYLDADIDHIKGVQLQSAHQTEILGRLKAAAAAKPAWWELVPSFPKNPALMGAKLDIVWPVEKKNRREQHRKRGKTAPRFSKAEMKKAAATEEKLIPVRLDIEHEQWRLRDTFVWNVSEAVVAPEKFAETICEDLGLPSDYFVPRVAAAIKEKAREADFPLAMDTTAAGRRFPVEKADWREDFAKLLSDAEITDVGAPASPRVTVDLESAYDLRIRIQLDIISGTLNLVDSFEWDLESGTSPEEFAEVYAADLGLNGEFKTAIAHDIREQIFVFLRSLALIGHGFDGSMVADADLRTDFLPPLTDGIRREDAQIAASTPLLNQVTELDLQQFEADRERDRKKKRGTRSRRMVALPDREPVKTHRTRVSTGVDEHGAPVTRPAGPSRLAQVPPPVLKAPSRRAAALAAQATISYLANEPQDDEEAPDPPPSAAVDAQYLQAGSAQSGKRKQDEADGLAGDHGETKRLRTNPEWACDRCGKSRAEALRENSSWFQQGPERYCPRCFDLAATEAFSRPTPGADEQDVKPRVMPSPRQPEPLEIPSFPSNGHDTRESRQSPLAFQDIASPDSSRSSSPRSTQPPLLRREQSRASETPAANGAAKPQGAPISSPASAAPSQIPPRWLQSLLDKAHQEHPGERYGLVYKGAQPGASEASAWRVKCMACPGKIYSLGPGETMQNFEVHLKNRKHLERVAAIKTGVAPPE